MENLLRLSDSVANFFKVILSSTIENQKLDIPKKFALEYGEELSNGATVIVPAGDVWQVGLERAHKRIWFVDGWPEFAEHYSLTGGQFLVFSYQGDSIFHVRIFDFSCCEIEYPSVGQIIKHEEYVEHDVCVDQHVTRKRKSVAIAKKLKKAKLMVQRMPPSHDDPRRKKEYKEIFVGNMAAYTFPYMITRIAKERQKLIHAIQMFKLENPFFAVILQQGHLNKSYLYVPSAYAMRYMRGCPEYIKFEDSTANQWDIRCRFTTDTAVRIGRGCAEFFRENNLKTGDVLLYELINKKDVVLKFSVLRAAGNAVMVHGKKKNSDIHDRGTLYLSKKINAMVISRETKKAMKAAKALKIENPAFMVILRDYLMTNSVVYVPHEFMKDHLLGCGSSINLRASRDEQWPARCTYDPRRHTMKIHKGFGTFCKENNLEAGDVCVFELIKNEAADFKVSVFHASDYASV
ncbi:PREDICTED: B3 domain-containing transcription factor VRN1-like [Fragaria vesca subsp. vesca]|uniref:B3 domain-containing transcription factor VRN1-like n=1 Tax=Fragaria vesca subsp. vesca TaxID=101020 RepID=UPI0002C306E4|nr:PREDICTED: B3 domain-containing transcription factor VRN1-like [Fragaria vesca subsp. vesca]